MSVDITFLKIDFVADDTTSKEGSQYRLNFNSIYYWKNNTDLNKKQTKCFDSYLLSQDLACKIP